MAKRSIKRLSGFLALTLLLAGCQPEAVIPAMPAESTADALLGSPDAALPSDEELASRFENTFRPVEVQVELPLSALGNLQRQLISDQERQASGDVTPAALQRLNVTVGGEAVPADRVAFSAITYRPDGTLATTMRVSDLSPVELETFTTALSEPNPEQAGNLLAVIGGDVAAPAAFATETAFRQQAEPSPVPSVQASADPATMRVAALRLVALYERDIRWFNTQRLDLRGRFDKKPFRLWPAAARAEYRRLTDKIAARLKQIDELKQWLANHGEAPAFLLEVPETLLEIETPDESVVLITPVGPPQARDGAIPISVLTTVTYWLSQLAGGQPLDPELVALVVKRVIAAMGGTGGRPLITQPMVVAALKAAKDAIANQTPVSELVTDPALSPSGSGGHSHNTSGEEPPPQ